MELIKQYGCPILQRLGYLLRVLQLDDVETQWFDLCMKTGVKFKFAALKPSVEKREDNERDKRWKIIINQEIDIDEI